MLEISFLWIIYIISLYRDIYLTILMFHDTISRMGSSSNTSCTYKWVNVPETRLTQNQILDPIIGYWKYYAKKETKYVALKPKFTEAHMRPPSLTYITKSIILEGEITKLVVQISMLYCHYNLRMT